MFEREYADLLNIYMQTEKAHFPEDLVIASWKAYLALRMVLIPSPFFNVQLYTMHADKGNVGDNTPR